MKRKVLFMSRIIKTFSLKDILSTNEVYDALLSQKAHNGRPYSKNPGKMTLTQILSKCPEFTKVGYIDEVTNGSRERVNTWQLTEEAEP